MSAAVGTPGAGELTPARHVARAIAARSLVLVTRIPSAFVPSIVFPVVVTVAFSGAFGGLTMLPGFPTDEMINWMLPMAVVQGAGFAGVGVGFGLVRDIETGFYDRVLLAPTRPVGLVGGLVGAALVRSLVPTSIVLLAGIAVGADLVGGPLTVLALVAACLGVALVASLWAIGLAVRIRSMQAAPLMQVGIFVATFFSTAQVPLEVMTGWLRVAARLNPMTPVLALARQGFIGDVTWAGSWPGLVAVVLWAAVVALFAARGWRRLLP